MSAIAASQFNSVDYDDLLNLLGYFKTNTFRGRHKCHIALCIQQRCLSLLEQDSSYEVVFNTNGMLCSHYPTEIFIDKKIYEDRGESNVVFGKHVELMKKSCLARCRSRFIVPVIVTQGKIICRSATIATSAELYGRSGLAYFFANSSKATPPINSTSEEVNAGSQSGDLLNTARNFDIQLLKELSVNYILDLMVEQKKVKFGMYVTSSEKVDKENRYNEFHICSTPYPGCETFREFRTNGFRGENLFFDWQQPFVDAHLNFPESVPLPDYVDWSNYKSWNLITLTQNYLLLILHLLKEGRGNLLIHCISGWDRTPLFISLIRLSLWADGLIHQSLNDAQILYLTIAYDWLLFGHDLQDRLSKSEEIFLFSFDFLTYITSEKFSLVDTSDDQYEEKCKERNDKLERVRTLFHSIYIEKIGFDSKATTSSSVVRNLSENIGSTVNKVSANLNCVFEGVATKVMNLTKWSSSR